MKLNQNETRALAKKLERKIKRDLPDIETNLYKSKEIKPLFEKWKKIKAELSKLEQERGKVSQSIEKALHKSINPELIDTCTWKNNRAVE